MHSKIQIVFCARREIKDGIAKDGMEFFWTMENPKTSTSPRVKTLGKTPYAQGPLQATCIIELIISRLEFETSNWEAGGVNIYIFICATLFRSLTFSSGPFGWAKISTVKMHDQEIMDLIWST